MALIFIPRRCGWRGVSSLNNQPAMYMQVLGCNQSRGKRIVKNRDRRRPECARGCFPVCGNTPVVDRPDGSYASWNNLPSGENRTPLGLFEIGGAS